MYVSVDRDVRDGVVLAGQKRGRVNLVLDDSQRGFAADTAAPCLLTGRRYSVGEEAEPKPAEGRHDLGLLEEQPPVHLPPLQGVVGQIRRTFGGREEDRVGLRQEYAGGHLEDRRCPRGVLLPILVGERVTGEYVDR